MTQQQTSFTPPALQKQPATRKKLLFSGAWLIVTIACGGAIYWLNAQYNERQAMTDLHRVFMLMAVAGTFLGLAMMINLYNKYADLANRQLTDVLLALPDDQLLLCGKLKPHVPSDEWVVIRGALSSRWRNWDVRLAELETSQQKDHK
ncbi:MAG: hypothetical protein AWU57_50 [Marinobacter sp. T13-3]|nr:MAG: hypothetical protein AWU57_50 [Marinobacter sp. T13-3]